MYKTISDKIRFIRMLITRRVDIKLSPQTIHDFCEKLDNWYLVLDENLESKMIRELYEEHIGSRYCSDLILSEIAEHVNTDIGILDELSKHQSDRILVALATNPNLTKSIVRRLIERNNEDIMEHLKVSQIKV